MPKEIPYLLTPVDTLEYFQFFYLSPFCFLPNWFNLFHTRPRHVVILEGWVQGVRR